MAETVSSQQVREALKAWLKATELQGEARVKGFKAEKRRLKVTEALNKVTGKFEASLESAAGSVPGFTKTMETFSGFLSKKATKSIIKFAGSIGLAAQVTKKYADAIIDINRALPGFSESVGQAFIDVADGMFRTGLDVKQFGQVVKDNGLAFRKFGPQITRSVEANEDLRVSLGLSRQGMTELTAVSANAASAVGVNAKNTEQLSAFSRKYIVNLNELALQTGRNATEVLESRVANAKGSANFLAELSKGGAEVFQQVLLDAERGGQQFAQQFAGIFAGDFDERIKNVVDTIQGVAQVNRDQNILTAKEEEELQESLRQAATGNIEAIKRSGELLTKFQIGLNKGTKGVLVNQIAQTTSAKQFKVNSAELGKLQKKSGATTQEAADAQIAGQRKQLKVLEDFFATALGRFGLAINKIIDLLGVFGGDITSIGLALFALKGILGPVMSIFRFALPVLSAIFSPIGGALALLAASAILVFARFERIKDGLVFLWNDIKSAFSGIADLISSFIPDAIKFLFDAIINFIKDKIPGFKAISGFVSKVGGAIAGSDVGKFVTSQAKGIADTVGAVIVEADIPRFVRDQVKEIAGDLAKAQDQVLGRTVKPDGTTPIATVKGTPSQAEKIGNRAAGNIAKKAPVAASVATPRDVAGPSAGLTRDELAAIQQKTLAAAGLPGGGVGSLEVQSVQLLDSINQKLGNIANAARNNPGAFANKQTARQSP